jgi:hypothetical protein
MDRRCFLVGSSALLGSGLAGASTAASQDRSEATTSELAHEAPHDAAQQVATEASRLVVPNGATLPHRVVNGVKVFHLVAEEFDHEIAPGLVIRA